MVENTLYYFYSTIAQVLAAISALVAVLSHFKINEIKDFLVGDGIATHERMKRKDKGYEIQQFEKHDTYFNRLRDSVGRKSLVGIKEVISVLAEQEEKPGPRGLKYLNTRFELKMKQLNDIKSLTKKSIVFAFLAIVISLVSLILVENLIHEKALNWVIILTVLFLTTISMIYTINGVYKGLKDTDEI